MPGTASVTVTNSVTRATQIAYTLVVSNTGTGAASNVTVSDTLPAGVKIVANPDSGVVSGSTVTWTIASLAPGASVTLNITVETQNQ